MKFSANILVSGKLKVVNLPKLSIPSENFNFISLFEFDTLRIGIVFHQGLPSTEKAESSVFFGLLIGICIVGLLGFANEVRGRHFQIDSFQ